LSSSQHAALSDIVHLLSGKLPKMVLRLLIFQVYDSSKTCQKVSSRYEYRELRPALCNATNSVGSRKQ
jgi:hydroxyacyl-ACP dehydratase HTD2-like protein with hotdog domain